MLLLSDSVSAHVKKLFHTVILPYNLKFFRIKFSGLKKSVVHYFQGVARFQKVPVRDQEGETKNPHPQKF